VFDQPREFGYYLSLYRDWRRGILPEPGSRMQQCAYVLEVLSIIEAAYGLVQEAMEEKAQAEARRGNTRPPAGRMHSRG
jgi:hypothetical protein